MVILKYFFSTLPEKGHLFWHSGYFKCLLEIKIAFIEPMKQWGGKIGNPLRFFRNLLPSENCQENGAQNLYVHVSTGGFGHRIDQAILRDNSVSTLRTIWSQRLTPAYKI